MSYLTSIIDRYRKASKALKSKILDELCKVCHYHRKYAIQRLANLRDGQQPSRQVAHKRQKRYGPRLLRIIESVWETAHWPWSVRLKVVLVLWLPWIRQRFQISVVEEKQLRAISASTLDRTLSRKRATLKHRIYGRTKPGTLLKHQIPIKTEHWDVTRPGFVEVDTVSHSGPCAEGDFMYSVNMTDIDSGWVETRAVLGKGETGVQIAIEGMRRALPFTLLGLDADNGSEFINYHLLDYCKDTSVQFTRSRPYKKDDNAHIEQKNWTHVRKLMGYVRYDTQDALDAMNDLYRHELRWFHNFFQPSVKLKKKVRVGSKLTRRYEKPQTPWQRVLASSHRDPRKVAALKALLKTLDPFELAKTIDRKLAAIYQMSATLKRQGSRPLPKLLPAPRRTKAQEDFNRPEYSKPLDPMPHNIDSWWYDPKQNPLFKIRNQVRKEKFLAAS
jgi:hypothetical protein